MKKLSLVFALALLPSACANLTAQQQANLQLELQLGEKAIQVAATLYCLYEPTTSAIIGTFDTSTGTKTTLAKLSTATALVCAQAQQAVVGN